LIADWRHVPKQAEVQKDIDEARDGYTTFALCTPTSIIPAGNGSAGGGWQRPPVRRSTIGVAKVNLRDGSR
jgi:hypothetical protein